MITNNKVLLADSDASVFGHLAPRMRNLGLEVVHALDGSEALDRLADRPLPGLVISSLRLPLIDGVELARAAERQDLEVQFVLFTADPEGARRRLGNTTVRVFDKLDGLDSLVEHVARMIPRRMA